MNDAALSGTLDTIADVLENLSWLVQQAAQHNFNTTLVFLGEVVLIRENPAVTIHFERPPHLSQHQMHVLVRMCATQIPYQLDIGPHPDDEVMVQRVIAGFHEAIKAGRLRYFRAIKISTASSQGLLDVIAVRDQLPPAPIVDPNCA